MPIFTVFLFCYFAWHFFNFIIKFYAMHRGSVYLTVGDICEKEKVFAVTFVTSRPSIDLNCASHSDSEWLLVKVIHSIFNCPFVWCPHFFLLCLWAFSLRHLIEYCGWPTVGSSAKSAESNFSSWHAACWLSGNASIIC